LLDLEKGLLDAVFPEIALSCGGRFDDGFDGKGFGDGDETNAGGFATG
jgi:hypothetical protein